MKTIKNIYLLLLTGLISFSCITNDFKEQANQQFGDQHFKTAIALIELHKIREGEYPEKLDSLKHMGDWDHMILNSVKYHKLDNGYELNLVQGWMGMPEELQYPENFWDGLGLKRSNLKK